MSTPTEDSQEPLCQRRRGSSAPECLAFEAGLKDASGTNPSSIEEGSAEDPGCVPGVQHRRSSQGVRNVKPGQKLKKPGCGARKRRRRLERLVVLYGPDLEFQKELLDKTMEKYNDNFVLPPMVTTMPADHPHIASASPAHKFVHVSIADFERMFVDKELLCHYHVFKGSSPYGTPATEGECTSAVRTAMQRTPTNPDSEEDCLGLEAEPLTLPHGSAPASMGVPQEEVKDEAKTPSDPDQPLVAVCPDSVMTPPLDKDQALGEEDIDTNCTVAAAAAAAPPAADDNNEKKDSNDGNGDNKGGDRSGYNDLGAPRLSHPTLGYAKSAPSGLDAHKRLALSIRHTFYFGYREKTIRAKLQEAHGGVVTLLLPPEPAAQIYSWCHGKFPNAFISTDNSDSPETLLRPHNTSITQVDSDSVDLLHEIYNTVLSAQRLDPMSYAEALAYFQSRKFVLERKAAGGITSDKKPVVNVSKIRLDRGLKAERDIVATVAGCDYNPEDPVHLRIAQTIYSTMTDFGGTCPGSGRHWIKLGCLTDSAPETPRAGLLAHMHVLHLMATDGLHSLLDDIFNLSQGGEKFKFMEVSSRLTQSVLQAMQSSYMQKLCNQRQQIFGVLNDLYVGGLLKFFEMFQCAITPPDITSILNDIDNDIRNHSRRIMLSVENHFQGYSFHAQVTGPLSVLRSTSLTSVKTNQNNDSEDTAAHMSQPVTPSLSNSTGKVGLFGRSSSSSLMQPEQRTPTSKSVASLKFIGS